MTRASLLWPKSVFCLLTAGLLLGPLGGALTTQSLAHADSLTCNRVSGDAIESDGIIDEWAGNARQTVGGKDRDASFTLRCAYDERNLYLAIEVRDDFLYRGKKPSTKKDDHVAIDLKVSGKKSDRLLVFPASDKVGHKQTFNGRKLPKWLQVENAQKRRGWGLEVSMPMTRLRGYSKSAGAITARVQMRDSDYAARVEAKETFDGTLALEGADAVYKSFLATSKLSARDIKLDTMANVDDEPGKERVIAGQNIIGIVSDQFFYMTLPVAKAKDVAEVKVVDLRGDGTESILTVVRQFGNGGSRDLLIVWQVAANQLQQVLAWEIRKEKDGKVLSNRWSLAPRGKFRSGRKAKRGKDLIIEVAESDAQGWDEDNYFERSAPDAQAILTPWSDQTSAVYYFEGNSAQGGEPKKRRGKRRR